MITSPAHWSGAARVCVEFDHQIFSIQAAGGISNSFARLVRGFRSDDYGVDAHLRLLLARSRHLGDSGIGGFLRVGDFRGAGRLCKEFNALYSRIRPFRGRIVHATYYAERLLPLYESQILVSTVHDMIPERMPQRFSNGNPHIGKRRYVEKSHLVVCVSETTRDELCALWDISRNKCVVVPHFVGPAWIASRTLERSAPYLLFVGLRGLYKRFDLVVEAFGTLTREFDDLKLVVVGAPFTAEEIAAIDARGLRGRIRQVRPSDAHLRALYAGATCLVFPSEAEGFGIPILEAFAMHCPIVAADIPVFREIGRDAVCFFPAGSSVELADRIREVVRSPSLRERLAAAGAVRLNAYSEGAALATLSRAYKALMS